MAITKDIEAKILRYYHVEKWRVGTISRHLNVHHCTIERVLAETGVPKEKLFKQSKITPYIPFIIETFSKYPTLTARRLYDMVRERGYIGGADHFRHLMTLYRPKRVAEAYLRLRTLPGEQAQVDWGHFGYITIGKAKRPLMAFVMVLSSSRKIFLRFYLNQRLENFLRGHEAAFNYFNGVTRVILYDNLKSAVLERCGDAIRFNPKLLEFAAHYKYEPRPVAVARGNEKGRVERAIRYIRDNFFAARAWKNIDDLNAQAISWCDNSASSRPCPEQVTSSVGDVFKQEQPSLLTLPSNPFVTNERVEVNVGKTPYVRFDLNDYSVPHTYVHRVLIVNASIDAVIILFGTDVIAKHKRSYDKGAQIEQESHIKDLVATKRNASEHRGKNRLVHAVPESQKILQLAAERNFNMGHVVMRLLQLMDDYGVTEMAAALKEGIDKQAPHPNSIRFILEKRRQDRNQLPLINLDLPKDKRVRELSVIPHKLTDYDQLHTQEPSNE